MINISIVMDNEMVFDYSDIVGLTLQHDFKGNASISFFRWEETKNSRGLCESRWTIGSNSDVESIVIKGVK